MENQDFDRLKKGAFKVPDGYFADVTDQILEKVALLEADNTDRLESTSSLGKSTGIIRKLAIATSAVAALWIIVFFVRSEPSMTYDLTGLDDTEIIEYLSSNADDIELEFLMSRAGALQVAQENYDAYDGQLMEYLLDEYDTSEMLR